MIRNAAPRKWAAAAREWVAGRVFKMYGDELNTPWPAQKLGARHAVGRKGAPPLAASPPGIVSRRPRRNFLRQNPVVQIISLSVWESAVEPVTDRPSHYTPEVKADSKNYYRERKPEELFDARDAPYQHCSYVPQNDVTSELYRNFRQNCGPGDVVALREKAPPPFVPGAAQPFLLPYGRHWSIHYERMAPESEAAESWTTNWICGLLPAAIFVYGISIVSFYTLPENGGIMIYSE